MLFEKSCIGETELGSSNQEVAPSTGKNNKVALEPSQVCVPTAISSDVDIPKVPGNHLLQQMHSWHPLPPFFQGEGGLKLCDRFKESSDNFEKNEGGVNET